MKLSLQKVIIAADALRMLNGAKLSGNGLYSIVRVDWLIAAGTNFSSTTALRFGKLEGLPSIDTMGPVNARLLQDVRMNHIERNKEERPERFLTTSAPTGQNVKMFKEEQAPPAHVTERAYAKTVPQGGDVERYRELKFGIDETIIATYDKAEMRRAKILVIASSDFVHTSKFSFWPDVIMLAGTDLDWMQSISMAIGVQRQTEMNLITFVFTGINDHLHSKGFLSRLRVPKTAEDAVWPAIKDILESMGEDRDVLKEGGFQKIKPKPVIVLSPAYAHLLDGLKFVYARIALLSEKKYDVIIPAPNREVEVKNLRPPGSELLAA